MPSRLSIKQIPTPDIQGDDSYIKYRPITMDEARNLQTISADIEQKRTNALKVFAAENNKAIADLTEGEKETAFNNVGLTNEVMDFANKELSKFILEWNWVDDDGKPLPQPKEDYSVLGKLYSHEYSFVMSLFNPENTKN